MSKRLLDVQVVKLKSEINLRREHTEAGNDLLLELPEPLHEIQSPPPSTHKSPAMLTRGVQTPTKNRKDNNCR
jgi:hypothetical protein